MNLNLLSHPRTGPSETAFAAVDSLPSTLNFVTPSPKNFYMFDDDCDSMGSNSITDSMGDADAEMCEIFQTSGSGSRGESGSGRQNQNDLKDVGNTRCPPPPSPIPWWGGNQQGQKRSFTTGFPTINDGGRSSAVSIPRPENPHASDLERSYGEDNVIRGKKRKNNNNGYEENKSNITNFKLKTTDTHTTTPPVPHRNPRSRSNSTNNPNLQHSASPNLNSPNLNAVRNRLHNIAPLRLSSSGDMMHEATPANSPSSPMYYFSNHHNNNHVAYPGSSLSASAAASPSLSSCSPLLGLPKFLRSNNDRNNDGPSSVSSSLSLSPGLGGGGFGGRRAYSNNDNNNRSHSFCSPPLNTIRPSPLSNNNSNNYQLQLQQPIQPLCQTKGFGEGNFIPSVSTNDQPNWLLPVPPPSTNKVQNQLQQQQHQQQLPQQQQNNSFNNVSFTRKFIQLHVEENEKEKK